MITVLYLTTFACKAQLPVVARDASMSDKPQGTYFKDLNNEFNKFEGTWVYTNGNTSFTIKLFKKEMKYSTSVGYYFDKLYGEYKYVENGVEIINTLPSLVACPNDTDNRNIGGGYIIPTNMFLACDDCAANERRVMLYFNDPQRSYLESSIVLRYVIGQNNPNKMKVTLFESDGVILPYVGAPGEIRVPYGEYLMVKQ